MRIFAPHLFRSVSSSKALTSIRDLPTRSFTPYHVGPALNASPRVIPQTIMHGLCQDGVMVLHDPESQDQQRLLTRAANLLGVGIDPIKESGQSACVKFGQGQLSPLHCWTNGVKTHGFKGDSGLQFPWMLLQPHADQPLTMLLCDMKAVLDACLRYCPDMVSHLCGKGHSTKLRPMLTLPANERFALCYGAIDNIKLPGIEAALLRNFIDQHQKKLTLQPDQALVVNNQRYTMGFDANACFKARMGASSLLAGKLGEGFVVNAEVYAQVLALRNQGQDETPDSQDADTDAETIPSCI